MQQCGQVQKFIGISIGSLLGLRTKCAVSNDLTQQEIRTMDIRESGTLAGLEERPGHLPWGPSSLLAELHP